MATDKLIAEWFWIDRWMGSSGFLLPIAHRGLYREMLTAAWRRGGRLPNDHEVIRRAIGCTEGEWAELWPRVAPYWRVDGHSLVNDTQLEIYAESERRQLAATSRGRAGAEARWGKREQEPTHYMRSAQAGAHADAQAVLWQCPPSPSPVLVQQERTAPDGARRSRKSEWARAVAIAHVAHEQHPDDFTSRAEFFKQRCAEQGIDYGFRKDGRPLYARVLDYVLDVRRKRGVAS